MKTMTKTNDAVTKAKAKHDAAVAKVLAAGEAHAKAVAALKAAQQAERDAAAAEATAAREAAKAFEAVKAEEVTLGIDFSRAVRSYTGKANCCRCGCAGNYSESKVGVTRQINRIKSLIAKGVGEVTIDEDYVDVDCGDKVYTVYFS